MTTSRAYTKTVSIDRPPAVVHAFLADPGNWPAWAVVNVLSVEATDDPDWWLMTTPNGRGKLRVRGDAATGLLDHDFADDQASWTVPARVVPNGTGSEFMMTFYQPPGFTDAFFDQQIALVDKELATLKQLLETAAG